MDVIWVILKDGYEVIGTLDVIESDGKQHKLSFTIMRTVEIPASSIPLDKLHEFVGLRIGILHLDNKFKIRKISI